MNQLTVKRLFVFFILCIFGLYTVTPGVLPGARLHHRIVDSDCTLFSSPTRDFFYNLTFRSLQYPIPALVPQIMWAFRRRCMYYKLLTYRHEAGRRWAVDERVLWLSRIISLCLRQRTVSTLTRRLLDQRRATVRPTNEWLRHSDG